MLSQLFWRLIAFSVYGTPPLSLPKMLFRISNFMKTLIQVKSIEIWKKKWLLSRLFLRSEGSMVFGTPPLSSPQSFFRNRNFVECLQMLNSYNLCKKHWLITHKVLSYRSIIDVGTVWLQLRDKCILACKIWHVVFLICALYSYAIKNACCLDCSRDQMRSLLMGPPL